MEIAFDGTEEELDAFLAEHPDEDVQLPFTLDPERIATLGREVEERPFSKSVVTMMGAGTTVVVQKTESRQVVLAVVIPEEPPEEQIPESEPATE